MMVDGSKIPSVFKEYSLGKFRFDHWIDFMQDSYGSLLALGYKFHSNASIERADEIIKEYEGQGLEVEVCEKAFANSRGTLLPGSVAIFTRSAKPVERSKPSSKRVLIGGVHRKVVLP